MLPSFWPSIPHVKSYYKSRLPEAKCQYMRNVTCRCPHVFDTSFNFWVSHRDSLCITATSFNLNRSANWQLRKDHNAPLLASRPLNLNSGWRCPVQRNQVSSNCHGWEINLDHLRESLVIAKYPVQVCNNILRFRFWCYFGVKTADTVNKKFCSDYCSDLLVCARCTNTSLYPAPTKRVTVLTLYWYCDAHPLN